MQSCHDANDVELIAIAVAVPLRDVLTTTCRSHQSVAHATFVQGADAVVFVITEAIGIGVFRAVAATHAHGVELVAVAVAVAF